MKQSTENGQTIPTLDDALTGMAHVVVHLLQVLSQLRPFQGEAERRGLLVLGPGVNVMIIILGDLSQFLAKKWQFLELFNFFLVYYYSIIWTDSIVRPMCFKMVTTYHWATHPGLSNINVKLRYPTAFLCRLT
jgi:hypothetical protein